MMQKFALTSGEKMIWSFFNIYSTLLTFNVNNDDKWSWDECKIFAFVWVDGGSTFHRYLWYYHYALCHCHALKFFSFIDYLSSCFFMMYPKKILLCDAQKYFYVTHFMMKYFRIDTSTATPRPPSSNFNRIRFFEIWCDENLWGAIMIKIKISPISSSNCIFLPLYAQVVLLLLFSTERTFCSSTMRRYITRFRYSYHRRHRFRSGLRVEWKLGPWTNAQWQHNADDASHLVKKIWKKELLTR